MDDSHHLIEESDEGLVAQVQAGDTEAFDELIRRYKDKIYSTIYHMTSQREDAYDLLQEVFLNAFKAIPRFRLDAKFSSWIYRIAVNTTINHLKQRRRTTMMSLDRMETEEGDFEASLVAADVQNTGNETIGNSDIQELQKKLNEAIQGLSEEHRTVVVMHDIQGMTHVQIADVLKIPEGTVKTRLFHAHKNLKKKLGYLVKNQDQ